MDDDADLVARLRAGDEAAFATLVDRYQAPLLRLALTFVPSRAVAEEVVQDTWLGVVRGIDRFEGRSSFKTWLFRILANRARTTGVKEHRHVPTDFSEPAVPGDRFAVTGHWREPPAPWGDDVEARLVARDTAAQVLRSLDDLPPAQRQVVVLRDVEGLPSDEVCRLLGLSEGNQRVLLHRGRAKVRAAIDRELTEG